MADDGIYAGNYNVEKLLWLSYWLNWLWESIVIDESLHINFVDVIVGLIVEMHILAYMGRLISYYLISSSNCTNQLFPICTLCILVYQVFCIVLCKLLHSQNLF